MTNRLNYLIVSFSIILIGIIDIIFFKDNLGFIIGGLSGVVCLYLIDEEHLAEGIITPKH